MSIPLQAITPNPLTLQSVDRSRLFHLSTHFLLLRVDLDILPCSHMAFVVLYKCPTIRADLPWRIKGSHNILYEICFRFWYKFSFYNLSFFFHIWLVLKLIWCIFFDMLSIHQNVKNVGIYTSKAFFVGNLVKS